MYNFCTYFDKNYLIRGVTLFRSLSNFINDFRFFIICLDNFSYNLITKLNISNLIPISLIDIERNDVKLLEAKQNRSLIEYFFTLSPIIPLYILENYTNIDVITYLDADIFFFSNPQPIFEEFAENSILIVEHRFPKHLNNLLEKGRFNVQCQIFRKDNNGISCLKWWRRKCLEWCYDRCEKDRYADQKYLDQFPILFDKLVILKHKGAGLAPWNWMQYDIKIKENKIYVDNEELIFFHFSGLKIFHSHLIMHGLTNFGSNMPKTLRKMIYSEYLTAMRKTYRLIAHKTNDKLNFSPINVRSTSSFIYDFLYALKWRQLMIIT